MVIFNTLSCISFSSTLWRERAKDARKQTLIVQQQRTRVYHLCPPRAAFIAFMKHDDHHLCIFQLPNVYQADEEQNRCNSDVSLFIVDINCATRTLPLQHGGWFISTHQVLGHDRGKCR